MSGNVTLAVAAETLLALLLVTYVFVLPAGLALAIDKLRLSSCCPFI